MQPKQLYGYALARNCARFIALLLFSSCLTPVEIKTENIGGRLVISGQVSTLEDQNIVQIGTTADTERLPFPVSAANVSVVDEETGESYSYFEDPFTPGSYLLENFIGTPGRTYHLQVLTPDGRSYESASEQMPGAVGDVTTRFEFQREQYVDFEGIVSDQLFIKIFAATTIPAREEPLFLNWRVDEAFLLSPTDFPDPFGTIPPPCYVVQNADPQRIVLFNGEDLNVNSFEYLVCSRVIDWTFLEKHTFSTYQSSLTKSAFEYWRKVNILANQVGSIFDTPPAQIDGNIHAVQNEDEKVYGYFQATNQVLTRFTVFPTDLPNPLNVTTCTYSENRTTYPARCLECSTVRNSSYRRPVWF